MVERARRLRVRPSQPGLRGPRETLPGPTTWVRPATGWWGRKNAGESPRNQGRTVWAPLSVSRRRSRGLRKNAEVERREANAQRHWACAARHNFQRWRLSALRSPSSLVREVSPRQRGEWKFRRSPRLTQTGAAEL